MLYISIDHDKNEELEGYFNFLYFLKFIWSSFHTIDIYNLI